MDVDGPSCEIAMPDILDLPAVPTTGLQTFAIFINFFFPALALVIVVVRNAGRLAGHAFGWDDGIISVAMLLSIAETVVSYFFIKTNFIGIHTKDIPPHDPTDGLVWNYAVQILYNPILALVKCSVLLFLLRLFGQKNGVRRFIIALNTFNLMQMVAFFFVILFQCRPIAFNWDKSIPGGQCVDTRVVYTTNGAINIVTDLLVLGLPLYIFVDLNIPRRTKLALLFVFLLGFLVTITSIVRLVLLVQGLFHLITIPDPTFNIGFVASAIELNLAVITASAPALRLVFRSRARGGWLPSVFPSRSATTDLDPEMASPTTKKWSFRPGSSSSNNKARGTKPTRGGGRGSLRGGRRGGRGRAGSRRPVNLRDIRIRTADADARALRSRSPRGSEEETMTVNGIMRVSDVQREIDGIVKDIAVGPGSFGAGRGRGGAIPPRPSTSRGRDERQQQPQQQQQQQQQMSPGFGRMKFPPERYYSESVYPEAEYRGERDYNEERLSKYGDRRFGVVTPKMTPRGWGEGGRPF